MLLGFKFLVFSILFLKFVVTLVSAIGAADSFLSSIKNYEMIDGEPNHSSDHQISKRQPKAEIPSTAAQLNGPKVDLLRFLKLINAIFPRLASVHDRMTNLLISASGEHLQGHPGPAKKDTNQSIQNRFGTVDENGWSLEKVSQANKLAEEELTEIYNMLRRALLTRSNEPSTKTSVHLTRAPWTKRPRPSRIDTKVSYPRSVMTGSSILRDCGGALSSGNGSITYVYAEAQGRNCLWVISSQLHKDYLRVTLEFAHLQGNGGTNLSIGYFSNNQFAKKDTLVWKKFDLDSIGCVKMDIPSVVAFVHLVSAPGPGWRGNHSTAASMEVKGFFLSFQGISKNNSRTSPSLQFASSFENLLNVTFTPAISGPNERTYAPNQRTAVALQPPSSYAHLYIKWYDIESKGGSSGAIFDSLNIWKFGQDLQWHRIDQLQGKLNTEENAPYARRYYFNNDPPLSPMILAFQTDGSGEFSGFEGYIGEQSELDSRVRLFVAKGHTGQNNYWNLQGNECISVESFLGPGKGFKSVDTYGTCVKVCDRKNCTGKCQRQAPGTKGHWNLDEIQLSNRVKSIQACI